MNKEHDIFNTLVGKAKEIKLTERERSSLFLAVDTYVKRNPITKKVILPQLIKSPFSIKDFRYSFSNFHPFHAYGLRTIGALLLLAIFGTGTSFAAQSSLPGDILYPIKVNVNEGIKAAFLSGVNRSLYEVSLVKTRVQEAKELAVQNKLSDKNQVEIATRIDSHVSQVKKDVDDLADKGELKTAFEISSTLEASLGKSETTPAEVAADVPVVAEQAAIVENIVRGPREVSTEAREDAEDKIYTQKNNDGDTLVIAEAKMEAVKKAIELIDAELALHDDTLTVQAQATLSPSTTSAGATLATATATKASSLKATAKTALVETVETDRIQFLKQVRAMLEQGQEKFSNKEYNEAFRIFRDAEDIAKVIQLGLEAEKDDITTELDEVISDLHSDILNIDTDEEVNSDVLAATTSPASTITAEVIDAIR